jgi:hypothetical protein
MTQFYKIRHKKTGLFSKGGVYVDADGIYGWTDRGGKTWDTIGKLRAHITSHIGKSYRPGTDMSDWEVVLYECTVKETKYIHEMIDPKKLMNMIKNA